MSVAMRNEGGQFPIFLLRAIFNFNKAHETYTATQIFQADITIFQKKSFWLPENRADTKVFLIIPF